MLSVQTQESVLDALDHILHDLRRNASCRFGCSERAFAQLQNRCSDLAYVRKPALLWNSLVRELKQTNGDICAAFDIADLQSASERFCRFPDAV
jgi:hypothetical protein